MAGETKERILSAALELFAQSGYLGTSMSDIAKQLGLTKAALYKHFPSKQAILDQIVAHMNQLDQQRAQDYQMPLARDSGAAQAYLQAPADKIRAYTLAQFAHWTQEPFSAAFRRMLTLEQYHDPALGQLFRPHQIHGGGIPGSHRGRGPGRAAGIGVLRPHLSPLCPL